MSFQDFYEGQYNKVRAFVYTPLGFIATGIGVTAIVKDGFDVGNSLVASAGIYYIARGITGFNNLRKQRKNIETTSKDPSSSI